MPTTANNQVPNHHHKWLKAICENEPKHTNLLLHFIIMKEKFLNSPLLATSQTTLLHSISHFCHSIQFVVRCKSYSFLFSLFLFCISHFSSNFLFDFSMVKLLKMFYFFFSFLRLFVAFICCE